MYRAVVADDAVGGDGDGRGAALVDRGGRGIEADVEARPRRADRQAVGEAGAAQAAGVADADAVFAVGWRVEDDARVAAVAGAAVVVAIEEREHREAVGRERRA